MTTATESLLIKHFPYQPSEDQNKLLVRLADFIEDNESARSTFLLTGYAGTGKTTCLKALSKVAKKRGYQVKMLAPTGRSAKIISKHTNLQAHTLHSQLYRLSHHPFSGAPEFKLKKNYQKQCLYIVDEASMIGQAEDEHRPDLLSDLIQFVFEHRGNKLVLVGDPAQLPPVGQEQSLGLNEEILRYAYQLEVSARQLRQVSRQQQESGILAAASILREAIENEATPSHLPWETYNDLFRIPEHKLLNGITYAYEKFGIANTLLICASNLDSLRYNQQIRKHILKRELEIEEGDLLIVSRNNYQALGQTKRNSFLANGEFVEVLEVREQEQQGNFQFINLLLQLPDNPKQAPFACKILRETLTSPSPSLSIERNRELYELMTRQYTHLNSRSRQQKALRKDPYLNALQVKYAYALTCHKAQGGQWEAVFVHPGFWQQEGNSLQKNRWLYTAYTRAVKELYLL